MRPVGNIPLKCPAGGPSLIWALACLRGALDGAPRRKPLACGSPPTPGALAEAERRRPIQKLRARARLPEDRRRQGHGPVRRVLSRPDRQIARQPRRPWVVLGRATGIDARPRVLARPPKSGKASRATRKQKTSGRDLIRPRWLSLRFSGTAREPARKTKKAPLPGGRRGRGFGHEMRLGGTPGTPIRPCAPQAFNITDDRGSAPPSHNAPRWCAGTNAAAQDCASCVDATPKIENQQHSTQDLTAGRNKSLLDSVTVFSCAARGRPLPQNRHSTRPADHSCSTTRRSVARADPPQPAGAPSAPPSTSIR